MDRKTTILPVETNSLSPPFIVPFQGRRPSFTFTSPLAETETKEKFPAGDGEIFVRVRKASSDESRAIQRSNTIFDNQLL